MTPRDGKVHALAMSVESKNAPVAMHQLAAAIYVELVARAALDGDGAAKMPPAADDIARLSFRLAETFLQAEEKRDEAQVRKTTAKADEPNIAEWIK